MYIQYGYPYPFFLPVGVGLSQPAGRTATGYDNFKFKQVSKLLAASSTCHPLRLRMDSSDVDPIQYMIPSFPWTHMSQLPDGISISSAVFAPYIHVTNTPTHRQTHTQTTLLWHSSHSAASMPCMWCDLNVLTNDSLRVTPRYRLSGASRKFNPAIY